MTEADAAPAIMDFLFHGFDYGLTHLDESQRFELVMGDIGLVVSRSQDAVRTQVRFQDFHGAEPTDFEGFLTLVDLLADKGDLVIFTDPAERLFTAVPGFVRPTERRDTIEHPSHSLVQWLMVTNRKPFSFKLQESEAFTKLRELAGNWLSPADFADALTKLGVSSMDGGALMRAAAIRKIMGAKGAKEAAAALEILRKGTAAEGVQLSWSQKDGARLPMDSILDRAEDMLAELRKRYSGKPSDHVDLAAALLEVGTLIESGFGQLSVPESETPGASWPAAGQGASQAVGETDLDTLMLTLRKLQRMSEGAGERVAGPLRLSDLPTFPLTLALSCSVLNEVAPMPVSARVAMRMSGKRHQVRLELVRTPSDLVAEAFETAIQATKAVVAAPVVRGRLSDPRT